ncbi:MAG: acyl-CoA dehydrogenase family protein [Burkholderiales bacterium]
MDHLLSSDLRAIRTRVEDLTAHAIAPLAAEVDREAMWPRHALEALREAGMMSLQVPRASGGQGQGLLALGVVTEAIARACPSSALCFGMHCVGTAVIAAKATKDQETRYLRPIAEGRHLTTLALSETGAGAHLYLPETRLRVDGGDYVVNGTKQFVTNGGHADSYVISTQASRPSEGGDFSLLVVDRDAPGLAWQAPWAGFGMRGNSSRAVELSDARVPRANLLGEEGDQVWYVFEVVAPYFLMAMAGTYLGIAVAAVQAVGEHLRTRRHATSGQALRHVELLQHRYADMWMETEKTRALIYAAGHLGDIGDPSALPYILSCKVQAAETAVRVTNEAMTLAGGIAYRENSLLARLLRDARAGHVMAPTTDMLKTWTGRALLGLPIL